MNTSGRRESNFPAKVDSCRPVRINIAAAAHGAIEYKPGYGVAGV